MNKKQLIKKAQELNINVAALHAKNSKGVATNEEIKWAIIDAQEKLLEREEPTKDRSAKDVKRDLRINGKKK
jgi:hypothetical protein